MIKRLHSKYNFYVTIEIEFFGRVSINYKDNMHIHMYISIYNIKSSSHFDAQNYIFSVNSKHYVMGVLLPLGAFI